MRLLLAVALALCVAAALAVVEVDSRFMFKKFVHDYNRKYATPAEKELRYNVFVENMARWETLRIQHPNAQFGVNKFADLSEAEFRAMYLMPKGKVAQSLGAFPAPIWPNFPASSIPASLFYGPANLTSPVKNQAQCGSCWAFSATEQIESVYAKANKLSGKVPRLSVEQIVQCDTIAGVQGCNGGYSQSAYEYVIKVKGLESQASYPYTSGGGVTGKCKFDASKIVANISKWLYVTSQAGRNETQMQYYLAEEGPISVCMDASPWQSYTGGVMSRGCPGSPDDIDHCIQAVGYGETENKVAYFTIRNSWGVDWGLSGYILIARNENNVCGIGDCATTAVY